MMNVHAIRAIYGFEMHRTWRTLMQSVVSPVLSTSLYFIVFGAAIGSRIPEVGGVAYTDLQTTQSSLEDIFVSLVHQP